MIGLMGTKSGSLSPVNFAISRAFHDFLGVMTIALTHRQNKTTNIIFCITAQENRPQRLESLPHYGEIFQHDLIDLMFNSWMRPEFSGLQTCRAERTERASLPACPPWVRECRLPVFLPARTYFFGTSALLL
jgi:hypothetical protein